MLTKIDLCSRALLKLGEAPITSFSEDTAAAKIAAELCDITLDALLCLHPWGFAAKRIVLQKTTDGFFAMPSDILRIMECDAKFEVAGNKIFSKADKIEIAAIARANPENFPPHFAMLAATRLAMEFCVPLTGDRNAFALLNAMWESELRQAKFIDAAGRPAGAIKNFSLIETRF
ncbi:MAG: hypothetical protein LBL46_00660 [Rickettsiales bacterium]|nr:hypothetical protein [Rickettsiales bacterium]